VTKCESVDWSKKWLSVKSKVRSLEDKPMWRNGKW
jgi:hypothetical protein